MSYSPKQPQPVISKTLEESPPSVIPIQQPQSRHAAEWGFVSLIMASVMAILAIFTLQIVVLVFFGPPLWAQEDLRGLFWASVVSVALMLGMTIAAGAFGIVSLVSSSRNKQPRALGLAGLLTSVFALLLWIFVYINWFAACGFLFRRQAHHLF